jgi:nucleotide-binding universal stress UspA family protein
MFHRILLAVDGSAHAQAALWAVTAVAAGSSAEVLVVTICDHHHSAGGRLCRELVEWNTRRLQLDGVDAHGEVESAAGERTARAILRVAGRFHADLIVMGSRGLSDLAGLLVGSVTHEVIHLSTMPVLVVPGREAARALKPEPAFALEPVAAG